MVHQGGRKCLRWSVIPATLHKTLDALALQRIRHTNGRRFRHGWVRDESTFHFGRPDAMPGHVEDVVGSAQDRDVAVFIFDRHVAGHITAGDHLPIALIARRIPPDGSKHMRKRPPQHQASTHVRGDWLPFFVYHIGF